MQRFAGGLAGLALALLVATQADARRVVAVTPKCQAEATEVSIDYDGARDMCVSKVAVTCPAGRTLARDRAGAEDRCVAAGAADQPPTCPAGHRLNALVGADECVGAKPPICPREYDLRVRPGEDACTY
jgi:hypothetical protein